MEGLHKGGIRKKVEKEEQIQEEWRDCMKGNKEEGGEGRTDSGRMEGLHEGGTRCRE